MKTKKREKRSASARRGVLFCIILGTALGILIFLAMLTLFSCILLATDNPHNYPFPLSLFSIYASAFFGGFIAVKRNGGRDALLCGALTGIAFTLVLCLIFLIIGAILKVDGSASSWLFRSFSVIGAVIGGLVAIKFKGAPKKRRKRKR